MSPPPKPPTPGSPGISIQTRGSKFHRALSAPCPLARPGLLAAFPRVLAADRIREILAHWVTVKQERGRVLLAMGAHPIKLGLNPVTLELWRLGWINALATNGAAIVHDTELALFGETSEEVNAALAAGTFGQTIETRARLTRWINEGAEAGKGLGAAVGDGIGQASERWDESLLAVTRRAGTPATVHVAIGTDVYHTDPNCYGSSLGAASMRDFRTLITRVDPTDGPQLILHMGSAVLLPEVLLKAFAEHAAQGKRFADTLVVNLDMIQQYRPMTRLVEGIQALGGKGIHLTGHHEINWPLLAGLLLAEGSGGE